MYPRFKQKNPKTQPQNDISHLKEQIKTLQNEIKNITAQRDKLIADYKALENVAQSLRLKNRLKNLFKKVIG